MTAPVQESPTHLHLAAQITVAQQAAQRVPNPLALLDLQDIRATTPRLAQVAKAISDAYGKASIQLAIRRFLQARQDAGRTAPPRLALIPQPTIEQIRPQVEWAVSGLYGPLNDEPVTVGGKLYAPVADRQATALSEFQGVLDRLVSDQGRDQMIDSVKQDTEAVAWARVPEPDCCYFCALLATRGAVYKADSFAGAQGKFANHADRPSDVKTHDHCRCHVEPVFNIYEPSAQIREWEALYADSKSVPGLTRQGKRRNASQARILGFRNAFDAKYGAGSAS